MTCHHIDCSGPVAVFFTFKKLDQGFPGGCVVKNLPANAGDAGSIPISEDPMQHGATKRVCHNY